MARQTRSQRRARRQAEAQAEPAGAQGAVAQRSVAREQQVRPAQQPARADAAPRRGRGGGITGFIGESWAELKKVEWPGQSQLIQATVVVLIACVIVGAYLYTWDQIWKPTVRWVLGQ